ncbi:Spo7-like protein-domain-containing protein [Coniella lustricola]|uniref:Spo7-like protein-domain-containing protein n=1 Tax=Coniella lustricola TaxID=2025994 RepID=A0A2T3AD68_9PEZI|nr:Spo7-like protein-domain-containing protein [Coniella lustricola]
MADELDSIVKGTASLPAEKAAAPIASSTSGVNPAPGKPDDPLSQAPSSPSMIYLNLLVLEASLRAQYLELRARRRHHTFFLSILSVWIVGFGYALFLAPREDGRGVGGSVYWGVELIERLCFMGGIITAGLVWATGIWERGVRWPRRWFGISNRGLRGFNLKLVLVKRSWWAEALSTIGFFLTYGLFSNTAASSYHFVDPAILAEVEKEMDLAGKAHQHLPVLARDEEKGGHEEDLAPGGDYVKLLLLAKPFSPTFRENWEIYRTEYWERENERRALIRAKLHERQREDRKVTGGWLWWMPWRKPMAAPTAEKAAQHVHPDKAHYAHNRRLSVVEREVRRSRSGSTHRGSVSGHASGSPAPRLEGGRDGEVSRRSSNASEKRKKMLSTPPKTGKRPTVESRSITPEFTSPLAKESSLSMSPTSESTSSSTRRAKASSDPA